MDAKCEVREDCSFYQKGLCLHSETHMVIVICSERMKLLVQKGHNENTSKLGATCEVKS